MQRHLWFLALVGCASLSTVEKPDDTDVEDDGDSDPGKNPVPDDTSPFDTGGPDPDTDEGEDSDVDTGDTGFAGDFVPASFYYLVQLGWTDAGGLASFTTPGGQYVSGLFVVFEDRAGRECSMAYGLPNGVPAPDAELSTWLSGLGLLSGVRVDPGNYVAYTPVYASGQPCVFDPSSPLATDPHLEMLRDPISGEIRPLLIGIGDTITPTWQQFLAGIPGLAPPGADWATSYLRLPFDVTTTVTGGGSVTSRNFELGTFAYATDTQLVVQTSGGNEVILAPSAWDKGGSAARAVYLMQSFVITF